MPHPHRRRLHALVALLVLMLATGSVLGLSPSSAAAGTPLQGDAGEVDFVRDVQPILNAACLDCHNSKKRRGGLRLDSKRKALIGGESGPAILPGKPDESPLLRRVQGLDEQDRMPLEGQALDDAQQAILRQWIEQGANWPDTAGDDSEQRHWAFVPPLRPAVPRVREPAWCENPIDAFVLARLEQEGLRHAPLADRAALIRRVSLDLIGLPPSIAEVVAFEQDLAPGAYERVVDRLLASPRYGERWAGPWLDLARYADTNGYEKDLPRSLWPWRDWVIRALNADMPFDEFTRKQLAGDLLPNASDDDRIATGFHRNTMLNDEGGIDKEEFRVVAVVDRVNTTASVWLGTTLGCAQCHDHKFDPFSQREYYQFYAFFDQTEDVGAGNAPVLEVPPAEVRARQAQLRDQIAGLETALALPAQDPERVAWEQRLRADSSGAAQPSGLQRRYSSAGLVRESGGFIDGGRDLSYEHSDKFSYGGFVKLNSGGCILGKIDDPHVYRGFDLFANDGRIEVHLVHEWPRNGIKVRTRERVAAQVWRHVFVTYDGSSTADGLRIYLDGIEQALEVENDTLNGTIRNEVALKIGSREASGAFDGQLDEVRFYSRALSLQEVLAVRDESLLPILDTPENQRSDEQRCELRDAFVAQSPEFLAKRAELAALRETLAKLPIPTTMVMKELSLPRSTHILERGNFRTPGAAVEAAVPAELHRFDESLPRNRLGLAKWLVEPENPLVGRVTMNRAWEALFGNGLVATSEDFGTQGDLPSHPELLDWLAVEFAECGWSVKAMHKLIVMSSTYRQSSRVSPELLDLDPLNHALARAPRVRLGAELVRDNALSIAGLLSAKLGGPSVMPPQPAGVWADSFATFDTPDEKWLESRGEDRWRRGIYTYLRRSAAYPSALTFDASRRDVCVVKRSRSNTPLQALITLNDPVFVEAAIGLATRMACVPADAVEARIRHGFELCVARAPTASELAQLVALHGRARERFLEAPDSAAAMTQHSRVDVEGLDPIALAALAVVANVLLNLDETITKG